MPAKPSKFRDLNRYRPPESRALHESVPVTKTGRIYGDEAARWLQENDPLRGKKLPLRQLSPRQDVIAKQVEEVMASAKDVERPWAGDGGAPCIYFIQAGETGPVKIGYCSYAQGLKQRCDELQVGSFEQLHLRRAIYGKIMLERLLHKHFAHLRIRGEWFKPDDELAQVAHLP